MTSTGVGATPIEDDREPTPVGRLGAGTTVCTRAVISTIDVGLDALGLSALSAPEILGGGDLAVDDGLESAAVTGARAYCPSYD